MKLSTDHQSPRSKGDRILSMTRGANRYSVRLAENETDVKSAQTLRFVVFNLEMNEGLEDSFRTLLDSDKFDSACDHLLVEDLSSGEIVGTYRLQTGKSAADNFGFYSQQEFDFSVFEPVKIKLVELGRACVRREHRNLTVLSLLWRGIVKYSRDRGARYLIGCSSLSSQTPNEGLNLYRKLEAEHLVEERFRTVPNKDFICESDPDADSSDVKVPKLLSAYMAVGAKICGPPAIDREFKTIDFLTFLDLEKLNSEVASRLGLDV